MNSPLALRVAAMCALATWSCESAPREPAAEREPAPAIEFAMIRGVVVDTSGRPVPDATIVGPRSRVAHTDEAGRFEFRWFRRTLDLYAERAGYYPSARGVGEPDGEPVRLVLSPKMTLRVNFANAPRASEVEPRVFVQGVSSEFRTLSASAQNNIAVVKGLCAGLNVIRVVLAEEQQFVAYDALFEFEEHSVVDLEFAPSPRAPAALQTALLRDASAVRRAFYPTLPNLRWIATHSQPRPTDAQTDELRSGMRQLAPRLAHEVFELGYPPRIGGFLSPPAPGSYLLLTARDMPSFGGYISLHVERLEAVSAPR